MRVTCRVCGLPVDHAPPGCAEHARRERDEVELWRRVNGGGECDRPCCAGNRRERRAGRRAR